MVGRLMPMGLDEVAHHFTRRGRAARMVKTRSRTGSASAVKPLASCAASAASRGPSTRVRIDALNPTLALRSWKLPVLLAFVVPTRLDVGEPSWAQQPTLSVGDGPTKTTSAGREKSRPDAHRQPQINCHSPSRPAATVDFVSGCVLARSEPSLGGL